MNSWFQFFQSKYTQLVIQLHTTPYLNFKKETQKLTLLGSTFLLAIKWSPAANKSSTVLAFTNWINANPRDCPENGSVLMLMFSISPYWVKYSRNSFSLIVLPRPPTNNFLSSSRPGPVERPLAFGCWAMSSWNTNKVRIDQKQNKKIDGIRTRLDGSEGAWTESQADCRRAHRNR